MSENLKRKFYYEQSLPINNLKSSSFYNQMITKQSKRKKLKVLKPQGCRLSIF